MVNQLFAPLTLNTRVRTKGLKGLFNCSMSLVFTLLCATNQEKALIIDRILDFNINLAREKGIISDVQNNAMENDLIENNSEEFNDHALAFGADGDKCT